MVESLGDERSFHEDALGLEPTQVGDDNVEYATKDTRLRLQKAYEAETLADFEMIPPVPSHERGDDVVVILSFDDLDEAVEHVRGALENGTPGEVLTEPRSTPWGDRIALVRSPSGYVYGLR